MKRTTLLRAAAFAAAGAIIGSASASDWTRWRGPTGNGYAPGCNPPTTWSDTSNIRWKVAIPGEGHSSPIILGDRIYLMTAVKTDRTPTAAAGESKADAAQAAPPPPERRGREGRRGRRGRGGGGSPSNVYEFRVLALDRANGAVVWNTKVREEVPHEGTHGTGSFAASTPVTDGKHIWAFFGSRGLFCLDLEGKVKWEKDLGNMRTRNAFGEGASVAMHGDMLVVPWDHEDESFVVGLDKATGNEKWRVERNEPTTWTTPAIVEVDGTVHAVVAGTNATISYELATGKELWRCSGLTMNVIPTPVIGHGNIYLMSGFRGSSLQAVRLDKAKGDISGSDAIVWSHDRGTPYVPSPLLSGRNLYFLRSNNGIVSCFDALTGEAHFDGERLDIGNVYSSIVGAAGHVYICGREGDVIVLADGPEFKVVAKNSLGEGIDSTPAIVDDEMYLRGAKHLFCIAKTE